MIQNILALLPHAKDETENIRIAKGKLKLAQSLKEASKQIKNEIKWQKNS